MSEMSTNSGEGPKMADKILSEPRTAQDELTQSLLERYGELMNSSALVALFKFPNGRAFRRAIAKGGFPVPVFRIPGRPGLHARTRDAAHWLATAGSAQPITKASSEEVSPCSDPREN